MKLTEAQRAESRIHEVVRMLNVLLADNCGVIRVNLEVMDVCSIPQLSADVLINPLSLQSRGNEPT